MAGLIHDDIARKIIHPISREAYHLAGDLGIIGEDVELLDGVLFQKRPKSPFHELVVRRLFKLLTSALSSSGLQAFVAKEAPLASENSEPEPDLSLIEGDEEDYGESHPSTALLVIEVAVSSQELDQRKASVYARAKVAEYWIVDASNATITVHLLPDPAREAFLTTTQFSGAATVVSKTVPTFSVNLPDLVERKRKI